MRATVAGTTAAEYRWIVEQTRSTINTAQCLILEMDALQRAVVPSHLVDLIQTSPLDDPVALPGEQGALLMALYFLNVRDHGQLIRDLEGSRFPDLRAARAEALRQL
jgi:hypothetical protein